VNKSFMSLIVRFNHFRDVNATSQAAFDDTFDDMFDDIISK